MTGLTKKPVRVFLFMIIICGLYLIMAPLNVALVSGWPEKQPRWSYEAVGTVNVVRVSSNGLYVIIGTSDGYVYIFNSSSNVPLDAASLGGSVSVIDISYDGEYVAAATGNLLEVYNTTTGSFEFMSSFTNVPGGGDGGIHSLAFSSDGKYLAVGTWARQYSYYDNVRTWVHFFEVPTGLLWSCKVNEWDGYYTRTYDYVSVDISSDGNYIVAGSTRNNNVYLFNKTSSTPLHTYDTTSAVNSVSMSSDGEYFVAGSNKVYYFKTSVTVPQWSRDIGGIVSSVSISSDAIYIVAVRGPLLYLLKNDNTEIWSRLMWYDLKTVSFSASGQHIVTSSGDVILLFSITTSEPMWIYSTQDAVNSVSVSSDGRYVAAGSGTAVYLFDSTYDPDLTPTSIEFSNKNPRDGDTIGISVTIRNVGNLESFETRVEFYYDKIKIGSRQIAPILSSSETTTSIACTVSPFGSHTIKVIVDPLNLIYESNETNNLLEKNISVASSAFVDTGANPIARDVTQTSTVNSVFISDNGYYFMTSTSDGYVYLFFRNYTAPRWFYDADGSVNVVSISADGSYAASAVGNKMQVFGRTNNEPLQSFTNAPGGGDGGIHSLAFSSDGKYLAVGTWARQYSYYDNARTWLYFSEVTTTNSWIYMVNEWDGYYTRTYDYVSVDISSDGNYIVAGSTRNNNVYLFDKTYSYPKSPIYSYNTGAAVNSVSASFNGSYFVGGSDRVYYFSKDVMVPLWNHDIGGTVNSVSISGNATYIAATRGNYVYLLRNDNTELWNYDVMSSASQALISKDGNYVLVRAENLAYLFSRTLDGNPSTLPHDPIWSFDTENTLNSISISSDGRYSAIASGGKIFYFDVYHKADLLPTGITFSNDQPNEGDSIVINATVRNAGEYKSYFTNVSFYDGQTLVGDAQIGPISPNSSVFASINYVCLPNERSIKVLVDSHDTIYESKDNNNELTTILFVNARPQNVTLNTPRSLNSTSIELTWSPNADTDFAKYEIYTAQNAGELGTRKETVQNQLTTHSIVTNLDASTTYYFTVRVVDTRNAFSDSNQVNATTLPTSVTLSDPSNPKPTSLQLDWTDNADANFQSYEIYKSTSFGELGSLVTATTNQSETTYTVTGLEGATTYYFTVRVTNPQGLFSDSNQVSGITLPTSVQLHNPTDRAISSLTLTWTKNEDLNFEKYEIYMSRDAGTSGRLITGFNDQTITTYTVTGLNHSTTYYFIIRVVGPEGLFSDSNQVTGTTLGPGWDFSISVSPTSQTVTPGGSTSYTVTVTGFGEKAAGKSIALSITGFPAGVNSQFTPSSVTSNHTSTLTISTSSFTEEDTYTLRIVAASGELTKTATITLVVQSQGIDLSRWLYVFIGIAITALIAGAILLRKRRQSSTQLERSSE